MKLTEMHEKRLNGRLPQYQPSITCPLDVTCPLCHETVGYRPPAGKDKLDRYESQENAATKEPFIHWRRNECRCDRAEIELDEAREAADRLAEQTARFHRLLSPSGLSIDQTQRFSFDKFDASRSNTMATAKAELQKWSESFHPLTTNKGFALSSPEDVYGCGKSHLAIAVASDLMWRGWSVYFSTMGDLLNSMRQEYGDHSGDTVGQTMRRASKVDVLLIDDFGTERIASNERGDWTREQLFTLFDRRYSNGKPIILTTNLTVANIQDRIGGDHGGRIVSRLIGLVRWMTVSGPDGRGL